MVNSESCINPYVKRCNPILCEQVDSVRHVCVLDRLGADNGVVQSYYGNVVGLDIEALQIKTRKIFGMINKQYLSYDDMRI